MELFVDETVIERQRVAEARSQDRPEGQQERVVLEARAGFRVHHAIVGVEPLERVVDELNADVTGYLVERIPIRRAVGKRLADGHRPVDELFRGGQERGGDAVAGEIAQREGRLETGDAAAGDYDSEWGVITRVHTARLRRDSPPASRAAPNRCFGKLRRPRGETIRRPVTVNARIRIQCALCPGVQVSNPRCSSRRSSLGLVISSVMPAMITLQPVREPCSMPSISNAALPLTSIAWNFEPSAVRNTTDCDRSSNA